MASPIIAPATHHGSDRVNDPHAPLPTVTCVNRGELALISPVLVDAGVKWHHTACALFTVQTKRINYGFEPDYAEGLVVCLEDRSWFSPKEYWDDLDDVERGEMDDQIMADRECGFLDLDADDQWEILGELDSYTVTGRNHHWEIVNSHFTKDAAEAFIRRKKHDHGERRVYVESQYYGWEFEAIKEVILDGTLTYTPKPAVNAHDLVSMEIAG